MGRGGRPLGTCLLPEQVTRFLSQPANMQKKQRLETNDESGNEIKKMNVRVDGAFGDGFSGGFAEIQQ